MGLCNKIPKNHFLQLQYYSDFKSYRQGKKGRQLKNVLFFKHNVMQNSTRVVKIGMHLMAFPKIYMSFFFRWAVDRGIQCPSTFCCPTHVQKMQDPWKSLWAWQKMGPCLKNLTPVITYFAQIILCIEGVLQHLVTWATPGTFTCSANIY